MADDPGDGSYVRPRIAIAFALVVVLGLLLWVDASEPDYEVSALTLTLLVGSVLALVGVEVNDILRGGK